ncbi:methyltransferase [Streptomyces sp. RPT161]|uniref:methyltransferase n=1 Tax=Streptomyces sp. RPT161 TaxID=3015993 RepID=UPI0022B86132|nr:methyltransferase [Streptomyces sp. RPT161]
MNDTGPEVFPEWMPPHLRLMQLVAAKWITQPLIALTRLNIADLLISGPRTVEDLADACGVKSGPLHRCLRATAAVGVFAELGDGRYSLTPMGRHLTSGTELSLRDFTLFLADESTTQSFDRILDVLRTGRPSFEDANGKALFQYLDDEPELRAVYQGAWAPLTAGVAKALMNTFDFTDTKVVADLGGGTGTLLRTILDTHPHITGILMDRPEVVRQAHPDLTTGSLANRVELAAGSLPSDVPPDADIYIIKNALHCLDAETVTATLRAVRATIGDRRDARLLLIESVITPGNGYDWGRFVDIEVMINCGGRIHTRDEWDSLLASCDFTLTEASELLPPQWLLSARPS